MNKAWIALIAAHLIFALQAPAFAQVQPDPAKATTGLSSRPTPRVQVVNQDDLPAFPSNRVAIAVLGFPDQSPAQETRHWSHAFPSLLRLTLSSAKAVQVLRRDDIDYGYQHSKIEFTENVNPAVARKIGELLEARRVVWGQYQRRGTNWHVRAWMISTAEEKPPVETELELPNYQDICSQLAVWILHEMQVTPSAPELRQLTRRHTSFLPALDLWAEGVADQNLDRPFPQIEQAFRRSLEVDSNFWLAQFYITLAYASQGKLQEAEDAARRSVRLNPDNAVSHNALATILMLSRPKPSEALQEFIRALKMDPTAPDAWGRLAQVYSALNEPEKRLTCLIRAAQLSPASGGIHAQLAEAYAAKGERDRALTEIAATKSLGPDDLNCLQFLAMTYEHLYDFPAALEATQRWLNVAHERGLNPRARESFSAKAIALKERLTVHEVIVRHPQKYTLEAWKEALQRRLTPDELQRVAHPLATSPEMKPWAEAAVQGATNSVDKARKLVDVLFQRLNYGFQEVRTAQEAFASLDKPGTRFICADLALLYVALGRAIGLDTYLVHVNRNYQSLPVQHDCAIVYIEGKAYLADPTAGWFGVSHRDFVALDDLQSTCHYLEHLYGEPSMARIAVKLQPDVAYPKFLLALTLAQDLKWNEAKAVLDEGLKIDPEHWLAYYTQGYLDVLMGRYAEAEKFLRKAIELMPTNGDSHYLLGEILLRRKKLDESRDSYRMALVLLLKPDLEQRARHQIAIINERLGTE